MDMEVGNQTIGGGGGGGGGGGEGCHTHATLLHHTLTTVLFHRKALTHIFLTLAFPISLLLHLELHLFSSSSTLPSSVATILLYIASSHLLLLILTLLSTTSIVRTITSPVSTSHKPLAITLLYTHFLFLSLKAAAISAVTLGGLLLGYDASTRLAVLVAASTAYVAGLTYAGATSVLACVVAAAEGNGGVAAWRRARELSRGRRISGAAWFLGFWLAFHFVELAYVGVERNAGVRARRWRLVGGGLLATLMIALVVVGTVAATTFYETCKVTAAAEKGEEEERRWYVGEFVLVEGRKTTAKLQQQELDP